MFCILNLCYLEIIFPMHSQMNITVKSIVGRNSLRTVYLIRIVKVRALE